MARTTDSLVKGYLSEHRAPSVAIAVVRGRDTLVMKGWGMADLEQEVTATAGTVYRIGSVTKQFTAAAVMQLVDQGKLRIDDSVATWLPALPAAWRAVTVRQVLNHTSGIPSYTDIGPSWARRWGEAMPADTLVALTAHAPMWFAPGTKWRYDDTGHVLLGMLIEKLTSHSWGEVIDERFAKPLGLTSTRNCLGSPIILHRAHGYEREGSTWTNTAYLEMSQPYAAGELKYGFGLGRDTLAGREVVTHGGAIHGFRSANAWIPSEKLSVTVLANSGNANPDALLKQLVRVALGAPSAKAPGESSR